MISLKHSTLLIFLLLPYSAFGQECAGIVHDTTIAETGRSFIMSRALYAGADSLLAFTIYRAKDEPRIVIGYALAGEPCFSKGDRVLFNLADSSRVELFNESSFNCSGRGRLYLGGQFDMKAGIDKLAASPPLSVNVFKGDEPARELFTPMGATVFQDAFKCVSVDR